MGMFDRVTSEINLILPKCPICKHKFDIDQEWQTKSYENLLYNVSLRTLRQKLNEFTAHTICDSCDNYLCLAFNEDNIELIYDKNNKIDEKKEKVTKILPKENFELYNYLTYGKETEVFGYRDFDKYEEEEDDY